MTLTWILFPRISGLFYVILASGLLLAGSVQAQQETGEAPPLVEATSDPLFAAPVIVDGEELFIVRGSSALPADERAGNIAQRIIDFAESSEAQTVIMQIAVGPLGRNILANGRLMAVTTEADSELDQMELEVLSQLHSDAIKKAILDYRSDRSDVARVSGVVEGALWTGACINGEANGRGTLVFWDENGFQARYDGDVLNGRTQGAGTAWIRTEDGTGIDRLDGTFRAGKLDGDVTVSYSTGHIFDGEFSHETGKADGQVTTPEGWLVSGEFKDGKSVGSALVYYGTDDGELYFGDSENKKRDGLGTLIKADKSSYFGDFKNGLASGAGVFKGVDGRQFLGEFDIGVPNGVGTAIDGEGTSYQGQFIDRKPDGLILVTKADGAQTTETWKDGSKVE